jgi:hypothetical protein
MSETNHRQPAPTISVIDPISQAVDRTRDILFRPFDIGKWFVLGFCAWLAGLGQGGGGGSSSSRASSDDWGDVRHEFHHAWEWVLEHLVPVLIIGCMVVAVIFVIWLLVLWLSSRGKFIFLDGVARNRGAVVEPWHRHRERANSLFVFRFLIGLLCGLVILGLLLAIFAVVGLWADTEMGKPFLILGVASIVLVFMIFLVGMGLLSLAIEDFLVPLMYLRNCGVAAAWGEFSALFGARPGAFVLYVVIRLIVSIIVGLIAVTICCATCCLVLLPYIGTVLTLPLWVFKRCYSLYFLEQFGPDYKSFAVAGDASISQERPAPQPPHGGPTPED